MSAFPSARPRWSLFGFALVCACASACDAQLTGASAAGGMASAGAAGTSSMTPGTTTDPLACAQPQVPRAPLRRITRFEYNNTVRDLLGISSRPADALPGEELGNGFGNDADSLSVSRLLIDGYRAVAQALAKQVTVDAPATAAFAGCDPAVAGEPTCSQQFIAGFLKRAFRRPADAADTTAYAAAFAKGRELGGDFPSGVRAVVERVLLAPQFLYRVELGEAVDVARQLARPRAYEMASRLSYLMWGSMPDAALFAAADQGKLQSKDGVLAEARRLLADPRAHDVVLYFHGQLFGTGGLDHLERNADYYPTFKPGMGALFRQETELFLDDVVWNGAGDLAAMFSAPYTFVNGPLAAFYGIPGIGGDAFQRVELDPARRRGVLTQASILSLTTPGSRTDPVVRGKWVYNKLLCGVVGDPPPNVPKLPEPVPGLSVRDRLAMHRQVEPCKSCHKLMDPLGFGFEHYDGVGLWRDIDNDAPIDDSGVVEVTDIQGTFHGAVELGQKLAQSADVQKCFVGHWLTYAYGRTETAADACSRAQLETAFAKANGNVKELLLALTQTDAFLYRPVTVAAP